MGTSFLVLVDAPSKLLEVITRSLLTAEKSITVAHKIFAAHGLLWQIVSDNVHKSISIQNFILLQLMERQKDWSRLLKMHWKQLYLMLDHSEPNWLDSW